MAAFLQLNTVRHPEFPAGYTTGLGEGLPGQRQGRRECLRRAARHSLRLWSGNSEWQVFAGVNFQFALGK
jgi:hypothetical protein